MTIHSRLLHLEWQALIVLYSHRERESTPMRLVGFKPALSGLMRHDPPLACWVGKPAELRVHITDEGITRYKQGYFSL
ncbi:MAG: hypothetical protein ABI835_16090 [Chloroflexota bacterium]